MAEDNSSLGAPSTEDVQASWAALVGDDRHVRYTLRSDADGSDTWRVDTMLLREALNKAFTCSVTIATGDPTVRAEAFEGCAVSLDIERGESVRSVTGIVAEVIPEMGVGRDGGSAATLLIVPALQTLDETIQSRMFQEKPAPDILKEVLEEGLRATDRKVRFDLQGTYAAREYCTQYGESDLRFVSRIMEENGISYHFEFDTEDGKELLVLTDSNMSYLEFADGASIPFSAQDQSTGIEEAVRSFRSTRRLTANAVTVRGSDWTRPRAEFESEKEVPPSGDDVPPRLEQYLHGSTVTFSDYTDPQYSSDDTDVQAKLHVERLQNRAVRARGTTDVTGLTPGMTFALSGHPDPSLDGLWLVVSMAHSGANRAQGDADSDALQEEYVNKIEVIPAEVQYRPERRNKKPIIAGTTRAKITGPAGEEVHVDGHGRVKVQFDWDREGQGDENTSCWMRFLTASAGVGFGSMFIPRIGMDVEVAFSDGDIDRPYVIGTFYNAENVPSLDLPAEKTRSSIRTNSTPGGDGYNEIMFEDAKGSELFNTRAEKDMNQQVNSCMSTNVGANQNLSVGGNRTVSVGGDETIAVGRNQYFKIGGKEGGKLVVEAMEGMEFRMPKYFRVVVGESGETFILVTPKNVHIQTEDGQSFKLTEELIAALSKEGSQIRVDGSVQIDASTGAGLKLTSDVEASADGGAKVKLDSDVSAEAKMGAKLALNKDVAIKGMNVSIQADVEAAMKGAAGSVTAGPAGADVKGPMVNVNGDTMVNVQGAMVKLN